MPLAQCAMQAHTRRMTDVYVASARQAKAKPSVLIQFLLSSADIRRGCSRGDRLLARDQPRGKKIKQYTPNGFLIFPLAVVAAIFIDMLSRGSR